MDICLSIICAREWYTAFSIFTSSMGLKTRPVICSVLASDPFALTTIWGCLGLSFIPVRTAGHAALVDPRTRIMTICNFRIVYVSQSPEAYWRLWMKALCGSLADEATRPSAAMQSVASGSGGASRASQWDTQSYSFSIV